MFLHQIAHVVWTVPFKMTKPQKIIPQLCAYFHFWWYDVIIIVDPLYMSD